MGTRGSMVTSRLHSFYPERFLAYGFLSVWYQQPAPEKDIKKINETTKEQLGYELYGYWSVQLPARRTGHS